MIHLLYEAITIEMKLKKRCRSVFVGKYIQFSVIAVKSNHRAIYVLKCKFLFVMLLLEQNSIIETNAEVTDSSAAAAQSECFLSDSIHPKTRQFYG